MSPSAAAGLDCRAKRATRSIGWPPGSALVAGRRRSVRFFTRGQATSLRGWGSTGNARGNEGSAHRGGPRCALGEAASRDIRLMLRRLACSRRSPHTRGVMGPWSSLEGPWERSPTLTIPTNRARPRRRRAPCAQDSRRERAPRRAGAERRLPRPRARRHGRSAMSRCRVRPPPDETGSR